MRNQGNTTRWTLLTVAVATLPSLAVLSGVARAATPQPTQPLALRFVTNYAGVHPMAKVVRAVLGEFTADFPTISVAVEETPGNDHQTKIKLDASSDRMPDVFNYWRLDPGFGLDQIARAGKLADLTDWTKSDPAFQNLFDDYSWKTSVAGRQDLWRACPHVLHRIPRRQPRTRRLRRPPARQCPARPYSRQPLLRGRLLRSGRHLVGRDQPAVHPAL